jgi:succinyl-diaminopimelate desuccinylase
VSDERVLAERLIGYETSRPEAIVAAAGFVKGWLESHGIAVDEHDHRGMPVLIAEVGASGGSSPAGAAHPPGSRAPCIVLHGHLDVVPGRPEQFHPRIEGDRLIGRGAYDMKGGLAAMLCALTDVADQDAVTVRMVCVPDEESEELDERSTDAVVARYTGPTRPDFAITGEPTDLHIGVEAKGVLAMRIVVHGRAAHSSTPWLGDNAVLRAVDVFRTIETLPFARESSQMFDRPSINLSRIEGGDVMNRVPDRCLMAVDVRYLPGQDPGDILAQVRAIPGIDVERTFIHPTVSVSRHDPFVRALCEAASRSITGEVTSVGRDGASDAASFIEAGIPAVEFGPAGGGHHGPEEWVSLRSLAEYRRGLGEFVRALPGWLAVDGAGTAGTAGTTGGRTEGLRAIDGGRS